jgi:thiamine biosynthesis lipoprotein
LLFCSLAAAASPARLQRFEYFKIAMGTKIRIVLYSPEEERARAAARAAFDRVQELDEMMTDYNSESELMRLCRSDSETRVSADLFRVLELAVELARQTGGAFDPSIGPAVRLWREARRERKLPGDAELAKAMTRVGFRHIVLSPSRRTVRLAQPGMRLDLGGIAKGYAADQALQVLSKMGHPAALVAAGGDIRVGEPPPGDAGWRVEIQSPPARPEGPLSRVIVRDCGISTSGDAEQFLEIEGVRFSHVVDPRTGVGVRNSATATVIAPTAAASDALATALCILDPLEGIRLAEARDRTAARIVLGSSSGLQVHLTQGMKRLLEAGLHSSSSKGKAR